MPRPVPGPGALVRYIQTGDRDARIAYRELPDQERFAYRDMVNRAYDAALSRHFGERPSKDRVDGLIERVAARHPQYGGGVKRMLRSLGEGGRRGEISPRQVLTAQHLIIREIAKLHPDFRERADRIVADASRAQVLAAARTHSTADSGADLSSQRRSEAMRAAVPDVEFTGTDPDSAVLVRFGLDGSLRTLELRRGVERMGGRSLAVCIVRAWVAAEKQRWSRARELGVYDSVPEPGSGTTRGDTFLSEAYSSSGLCRATVDRYGRLRGITFMRTGLFGVDGRLGLTAEIREAIDGAQAALKSAL